MTTETTGVSGLVEVPGEKGRWGKMGGRPNGRRLDRGR